MSELFRIKVVSKRQVTLPERLMDLLKLQIGSELQVEVRGANDIRLIPVSMVRTELFTPEILRMLEKRERELETQNLEAVDSRAALKPAANNANKPGEKVRRIGRAPREAIV